MSRRTSSRAGRNHEQPPCALGRHRTGHRGPPLFVSRADGDHRPSLCFPSVATGPSSRPCSPRTPASASRRGGSSFSSRSSTWGTTTASPRTDSAGYTHGSRRGRPRPRRPRRRRRRPSVVEAAAAARAGTRCDDRTRRDHERFRRAGRRSRERAKSRERPTSSARRPAFRFPRSPCWTPRGCRPGRARRLAARVFVTDEAPSVGSRWRRADARASARRTPSWAPRAPQLELHGLARRRSSSSSSPRSLPAAARSPRRAPLVTTRSRAHPNEVSGVFHAFRAAALRAGRRRGGGGRHGRLVALRQSAFLPAVGVRRLRGRIRTSTA